MHDEELLDEFFQLGEDLDSDVVPEFGKLGNDQRTKCYPFWVERYAKGEVCIHVHYGIRSRDSGREGSDCCAVFERASDGSPLPYVQVDVLHAFNPEGGALQDGTHEMGSAMLVPDVEAVENPQWVPFGAINSTVRLQPLNHCLGTAVHTANLVEPAAPVGDTLLGGSEELASILENGEFGTVGSGTGGASGKNISQVVQAGPQIVAKLSDENLEPFRRYFANLARSDVGQVARRAQIKLADNAVWLTFEERLDFSFDRFQVLVRPV